MISNAQFKPSDLAEGKGAAYSADPSFPDTAHKGKAHRYGSIATTLFAWALTLVGAAAMAKAHVSTDPIPVALLFLLVGQLVVAGFGWFAQRCFILSFGACVFIGGLCQLYALNNFGELHTTSDAQTFYWMSQVGLGTEDLEDIKTDIDAPLAIQVWRTLYSVLGSLGLDNGLWVGLILNALLVATTGAITVCTARIIFGQDSFRLRRIGSLYACCGMLWLFGAIFLRDSFVLLINSLVLWGLVRFLKSARLRDVIAMSGIVLGSFPIMYYIREEGNPITLFILVIGIISYTRRGKGGLKIFFLGSIGLMLLLILGKDIAEYLGLINENRELKFEGYNEAATSTESLGYALIVSQPMLIRLFLGSLYLLVFPIPFWCGWSLEADEYHWLKSYQGLYMILVAPLGFLGAWHTLRISLRDGVQSALAGFLLLYSLFGLIIVAATTLETRHHGQFLPAFLILCAWVDTRLPLEHKQFRRIQIGWYGAIAIVHLAWVFVKGV